MMSHERWNLLPAETVACKGPEVMTPPDAEMPADILTVWVPLTTTSVNPDITVVWPEIEIAGLTGTVAPFGTITAVVPPGRIVVLPGNDGRAGVGMSIGIV